jgi:hypothetical protein
MAAARKSTMTAEHKRALAEGRAEGRAVRAYLEALDQNRPRRGRPRTPASIEKRLKAVESELADAAPLHRLQNPLAQAVVKAEQLRSGNLGIARKSFLRLFFALVGVLVQVVLVVDLGHRSASFPESPR